MAIRPVHINALLAFLGDHRPGTALIGVAKLGNPKLKFEIEAIVAVQAETRIEAGKVQRDLADGLA